MILAILGDMDLKTLIVAQSVCTRSRGLIETIVLRTRNQQLTKSGELEFAPLLRADSNSLVHAREPTCCLKS
ncbi:hypothetical protein PG984_010367 [Apiospora sp. TS-2023a]